jgi:microcystin-dependent protein
MDGWYIGTVTLFAFNWAPLYYAQCNGALLPINQMAALYSLLGIKFGGDGRTTFGLPDLRGRVPCGFGPGPGLTPLDFAEYFGAETVQLNTNTLPVHSHPLQEKTAGQTVTATAVATVNAYNGVDPDKNKPQGAYWAKSQSGTTVASSYNSTHDTTMAADAVRVTVTPTFNVSNLVIGNTGNSQPFPINPPSLALMYCVCTQGLFPTRP